MYTNIHTFIYTVCPCGYSEERQELRDAQHQQGATRHSAMYSNNRLLRVLFPFAGILRQYTQILIRETAVRSAMARRRTLAAKPLPQHQHVDRGSRQPQSASQLAASGIRHSRGGPSSSPSLRVSSIGNQSAIICEASSTLSPAGTSANFPVGRERDV